MLGILENQYIKKLKYLLYEYNEEIHSLFNLCSELKELYVSITRAKTFLFFYEENNEFFQQFLNLISEFNLFSDDYEESINNAIQYLNENLLEKTQLEKIAEDNYINGNYKKSEYYYTILGNDVMKIKSEINLKYEKIEKIKASINYNKIKFKELNNDVLKLINQVKFDEKNIKGEIYLNLENYTDAFNYFKEKKNYFKCGLIRYNEKKYEEAFNCFNEAKKYSNAIECLDKIGNYKKLFNYIKGIKTSFDLEHFIKYYIKYSNQFLKLYDIKIDKISNIRIKEKIELKNTNIIKKDIMEYKNEELLNLEINYDQDNDLFKYFPKLQFYDDNQNYFGINIFREKVIFPGHYKTETYAITDKIESDIFVNISSNKLIYKNIEEHKIICNYYIDILNFIINYLQITEEKAKIESIKNTNNFIITNTEQIKNMKSTLYQIDKIDDDNKKEEILDNLFKIKFSVDEEEIIEKVKREFKLNETSKRIIDIIILKQILYIFLLKYLHIYIDIELNMKKKI